MDGHFDANTNFRITDTDNMDLFLSLIPSFTRNLQREIWSTLVVVISKSIRNLSVCGDIGFLRQLLPIIPKYDDVYIQGSLGNLHSRRILIVFRQNHTAHNFTWSPLPIHKRRKKPFPLYTRRRHHQGWQIYALLRSSYA